MKLSVFLTFVACLIVGAKAASYGGGGGGGYAPAAPAPAQSYSAPAASSYGAHAPASGGYGQSAQMSIPAPPCPKNYLFSCSPNLTPAPCSQAASSYGSAPSSGYGSAGSYSHNYPVYAVPSYEY